MTDSDRKAGEARQDSERRYVIVLFVETENKNLTPKAGDYEEVNLVNAVPGSKYNDIVSRFEAMIKYLDRTNNWLKAKYTL